MSYSETQFQDQLLSFSREWGHPLITRKEFETLSGNNIIHSTSFELRGGRKLQVYREVDIWLTLVKLPPGTKYLFGRLESSEVEYTVFSYTFWLYFLE
jgi:hypothetical protein